METRLILLVAIAVYTEPVTETSQLTTLPINERIEELKKKHQPNIQLRRVPFASVLDTEDSEDGINYESEQSRDFKITPIVSTDQKKTKYKATETTAVKSTAKSKTGKGHTTQSHALHSNLNASLSKIKKKHLAKPAEVFYRRYEDEETRDKKWKWAHCQDMVTPFLTGIKKETNGLKRLTIRDPTVLKLFQLLSENTTTYTAQETYSIISQINTMQLRFFHWDLVAMRALLNIVTQGQSHTFTALKRGLRALFNSWHLDWSNTTLLLKDTRIIRPLCTETSHFTGSTKAQKIIKYKEWLTTYKRDYRP